MLKETKDMVDLPPTVSFVSLTHGADLPPCGGARAIFSAGPTGRDPFKEQCATKQMKSYISRLLAKPSSPVGRGYEALAEALGGVGEGRRAVGPVIPSPSCD